MRLTDREWKEFKISDLFKVELSKGDIKFDEIAEGNIPLISSGRLIMA